MNILIVSILLMLSINSKAQISNIELRATGLTCSMCSNAIYKQLQTIQGVDSIATDINTSTYYIWLSKENNLTPRIFKENVEKAGFFIGYFVATAKSDLIVKSPYILVDTKTGGQSEVRFQVLDKGFVTAKEYKILSKLYKRIETYGSNNEDDFHIKLLD